MRFPLMIISIAVIALTAGAASAEEGGCAKYGAGGAVAGHFVGSGHALAGAAAGCAVGAYKRHEARKDDRDHQEAIQDDHDHDRHDGDR